MVTKFVPLPDNDGGKQRALALATRLAQHAEVVLCAYDDGDGDVAGLKRLGIDVRSVPWRPTATHAPARRAADPQCLGRPLLQPRARRRSGPGRHRGARRPAPGGVPPDGARGAPRAARHRVLDLHNVESALVRSYARRRARAPGHRRPCRGRGAGGDGAVPRARFRHRGRGEQTRAPPPARGRGPRPRLSQRQGPRSGRTAAPCPPAHGRLRGHHGLGAQCRCGVVVRRSRLARGAPTHARRPPAAGGKGPRPPRAGPRVLVHRGFRYRF